MSDITLVLEAIGRGDDKASSELLPLVYDELRRLAAARMAQLLGVAFGGWLPSGVYFRANDKTDGVSHR